MLRPLALVALVSSALIGCASPVASGRVAGDVDVVEPDALQIVVEPAPPRPTWPEPGALEALEVAYPDDFGVRRVYLDAGHGAAGNPGATNARCESEQDVMLRIATGLEQRLEATGRFDVRVSRGEGELVDYGRRIAEAEAWPAHVFVSLHLDARGEGALTEIAPGVLCPRSAAAPGFSVLWSDEGTDAALVSGRQRLARAVAARMAGSGWLPYDGFDYEGLYAGDPAHPGVFVDRHAARKRIRVLRRPKIPSVIVETHHGWDPREVERWDEPATLDVFAAAIAGALVDLAD